MEHICDKHDECYHQPLDARDRLKKWLVPGSYIVYLSIANVNI